MSGILESVLLQSGIANYADMFRQPDGQLESESGQVPHYESGILSAYPSPSTFNESGVLIDTPPAPSGGYDIGQNIFSFDFLSSEFSQDTKFYKNENIGYLNPYIHYYPKKETVVGPLGTIVVYSPIKISALSFTLVPISANDFYTYVPEED